jgi:hypothetical protein
MCSTALAGLRGRGDQYPLRVQVCSLDDYENDRPCLHGFAAQGLSDPSRRNYDKLWNDMRSLSDYFHPSPTSVKVRS